MCVLLSAISLAQPGPPMDLLECLPSDVDMVVAVQDAGVMRDSAIGRTIEAVLSEDLGSSTPADGASLTTELSPLWTSLAAELGMQERAMFDELLGTRVVFASRGGSDKPASREWVVISDVALATEQRLRERLQAAPRSIDAGHQLLSIEKGAYTLTTHRPEAGTHNQPAQDGRTLVLLAPASRDRMLVDVVRELSVRAGGTATSRAMLPACVQARSVCEPIDAGVHLLVMVRLDAPGTVPGGGADQDGRWPTCLLLAGRRDPADEQRWNSRLISRRPRPADSVYTEPPISSDAPFEALRPGSVLAIVQTSGFDELVRELGAPWPNLLALLPIPSEARRELIGRLALWVRTTHALEHTKNELKSGGAGRVAIAAAVELREPERFAKELDTTMTRFVTGLEERFGVSESVATLNYAGAMPRALRSLSIRSPGGDDAGFPLISSDPLVASWACLNMADADVPGWLVAQIVQHHPGDTHTPQQVFVASTSALASAKDGRLARWGFLAAVKPAELERVLPVTLPDIRGVRAGMREIDELIVRISATDGAARAETSRMKPETELVGEISVRIKR